MRTRILYVNLTYYCDNDCTFCFSHTTGCGSRRIAEEDFLHALHEFHPCDRDVIVINGGEPSLHPGFVRIVNHILSSTDSFLKVYTNGRHLSELEIARSPRLTYVIPIHGDRILHDNVTRVQGSYDETVHSVATIQENGQPYALKFIVTPELVDSGFNINRFLKDNRFSPYEIFVARLNETIKSKRNWCRRLDRERLESFVSESIVQCRERRIKLLDIPPCAISDFTADGQLSENPPEFYFCDDKTEVGLRIYKKQVKIFGPCDSCPWSAMCETMSRTYLTLVCCRGNWSLEAE